MNTKSIFLVLCCLTAFPSYAQHVPTLEEVVNGGLIVTKGESRVNWLSEGNSFQSK
jgi:dipeptidyl-peptidase-4